MDLLILFVPIVVLLVAGIPIGVAIGAGVVAWIAYSPITNLQFLAQTMYSSVNTVPLLAVPFFMLSGSMMEGGGLSKRLVAVGEELVGNTTGGLANVAIVACLFFGAVSGSAPATVAAIGTIMIPSMTRLNYDKAYATGLMAVAGSLGVIIPPSIPMVFYALATNASVPDMFTAGIGPGILVALFLIAANVIISKKRNYLGTGKAFSPVRFFKALWEAKWALLVPIIILGGIYGGIFTPTEASVASCVYALFAGTCLYKELKIKDLPRIFKDTGILFGSVVLTIATATALGGVFSYIGLPAMIGRMIGEASVNKYVILLIINVFLIFVGMIMDPMAAILILAPIFMSIVGPLGIDVVHMGIIMVVNLGIGFVTPPVAINLYVASSLSGLPITKVTKAAIPFLLAMFAALLLITFVEPISMGLVRLMG